MDFVTVGDFKQLKQLKQLKQYKQMLEQRSCVQCGAMQSSMRKLCHRCYTEQRRANASAKGLMCCTSCSKDHPLEDMVAANEQIRALCFSTARKRNKTNRVLNLFSNQQASRFPMNLPLYDSSKRLSLPKVTSYTSSTPTFHSTKAIATNPKSSSQCIIVCVTVLVKPNHLSSLRQNRC